MLPISNNFFFSNSEKVLYPIIEPEEDLNSHVNSNGSKNAKKLTHSMISKYLDNIILNESEIEPELNYEELPEEWFDENEDLNRPEVDILPSFYRKNQYENDCLRMFSPKQGSFADEDENKFEFLEKIERTLPNNLNGNLKSLNALEKIDAGELNNFFQEFPKTPLFQDILESVDYDPEESTRLLIELMHIEERNKSPMSLHTLLRSFLRKAKTGFPILKYIIAPGGNGASKGHYRIQNLGRGLRIQEMLKKLDFKLSYISQRNHARKKTFYPADDVEPRNIRSWSDQILYSELLLPDDLFYYRLTINDLHTFQHFEYINSPRTYVMLVDVSGSMNSNERIEFACASAISLVSNALIGANKGIIHLFDDQVHPILEFKNVQDVTQYFLDVPFSGGGTSIDVALKKADTYDADEIILITDGCDSVSYIPKSPLYTIFCDSEQNDGLVNISRKFELYQQIIG
jgi:hypothetical protein